MRISDVAFDIETGEVLRRWNAEEYSGPVALARGENEKAWNRSQIAKSNAGLTAAQGYGAQAAGENPAAQFQALATTPMSAEEKAGRLSATGGAYDAMAEKAGERQARTRNSAGYGSLLDELARGKSRAMGETAGALGGEEFNRRMAALHGMGGIYGTDVGAQTSLLRPGQPVKQPGFWGDFLNTLVQSGAQVGAAALGGGG